MASNYPTEVVSQSGDELVIRVFIRPVATVVPNRTRTDPAVSTEGVHPFGPGDVSVSSQDVRVRLARGETLTPSRRQVYGQRGRGPRRTTQALMGEELGPAGMGPPEAPPVFPNGWVPRPREEITPDRPVYYGTECCTRWPRENEVAINCVCGHRIHEGCLTSLLRAYRHDGCPVCVDATTYQQRMESGRSKDQEGLSEDEKLYIIIAVVVVVVVALVVVVTFIVLRRGRMANSRQGEQQRGGVATGNIDENPYHDLEGPDVVTSHNVINHSDGAYDRVELDVLNVGAVTGSVKVKPAVNKSTKPKSSKKSKKEEKKVGTAPPFGAENLYGEIKKTQPSSKVKKSQKKQEPEPLYAEAPPLPIKQLGEQEVDLVDNDLYDRSQQPSASNQANVSAGDGQGRFSDGNAYEDVDRRKTKGYTNTAVDLVANDLYDSMQ